jgi:hypothetical protein
MKLRVKKLIPTLFFILSTQALAGQEENIKTEIEQYCTSLMQQEKQSDESMLKECIQEQFEYINHQTDTEEPESAFDE